MPRAFVQCPHCKTTSELVVDLQPTELPASLDDSIVTVNQDVAIAIRAELESSEDAPRRRMSGLSDREIEVLRLIAKGQSNKQIARFLAISDQTVKNHITSILRKLSANDRTEAVVKTIRAGLIEVK